MNPINAQKLTDELTALLSRDVLDAIASPLWQRDHEPPHMLVTTAPQSVDHLDTISIPLAFTWGHRAQFNSWMNGKRLPRHIWPHRQIRIVAIPRRIALRHGTTLYNDDDAMAVFPETFLRNLPQMIADGDVKRLVRAAIAA